MAFRADDERWMAEALVVASEGLVAGELPIGAVIIAAGQVIGRAHTEETRQRRLLVHAELLALDQADRVQGWDRAAATLYTTLEPCLMCLGATASAMVGRIVYAMGSDGDGAAGLAERWDHDRTDDLPHVKLPIAESGVGRVQAETLFGKFIALRDSDADPMVAWAKTLVTAT